MDQPVTSAEQVADLLETVVLANGEIAAEAARIAACDHGVSQAMVERLTSLGERLQPGATARARLGSVDPELLLAGTRVWLRRRRSSSARVRARARWAGSAA